MNKNDTFKPNTIVLAKVKGYPAWPAMIIDEELLPESVSLKKPKMVKGKMTKNKIDPYKSQSKFYCVRFFSDDTYVWLSDCDLKFLDDSIIKKYIENFENKKKKDNSLFEAYVFALKSYNLNCFIKKEAEFDEKENHDAAYDLESNTNENQTLMNDNSMELDPQHMNETISSTTTISDLKKISKKKINFESEENQPQKKILKRNVNSEKKLDFIIKFEQPPFNKKNTTRVNSHSSKNNHESCCSDEYDSDWDLCNPNAYNHESGNYVFDTEKEQNDFFSTHIPSVAMLQSQQLEYQRKFDFISKKLLKKLFFYDKDELLKSKKNEILDGLDELAKLFQEDLPKSIILKSKLLRVSILVLRKPTKMFPDTCIKKKISNILKTHLDIDIKENTIEDSIDETNLSKIS